MPFGHAGVEPTLIVSEAVPPPGIGCWLRVEEMRAGVVRVLAWDCVLHSLTDAFFQEGLGAVGQKGDRVCTGSFQWGRLAWPSFLCLSPGLM